MNGVMFINLNLEDNLQDTEKFWSKLRLDLAELKKTDFRKACKAPLLTTISETRSRCCWRFIAMRTDTANSKTMLSGSSRQSAAFDPSPRSSASASRRRKLTYPVPSAGWPSTP